MMDNNHPMKVKNTPITKIIAGIPPNAPEGDEGEQER